MFTTASKLYFGLTALALAVYGLLGWATAWAFPVTVTLMAVAIGLGFVGGVSLAFREVTAGAIVEGQAVEPLPALLGRSVWPLVTGLGAALSVVGFVYDPWLAVLGLVFVAAGVIEWVVQDWAEEASGDARYNRTVRGRVLRPLEFPVLGALCAGLVVWGFSRVMLALPTKTASIVVFVAVATVVLALAALFALGDSKPRALLAALGLGALGVFVAGVAGAAAGERDIESHETSCDGREAGDENANAVSAKSSVAAEVTLNDEALVPDEIVLVRANSSTLLFHNEDTEPAQLLIEVGEQPKLDEAGQPEVDADGNPVTETAVVCTGYADEGQSQSVTLRINTPGRYPMTVLGEGEGEDRPLFAEGEVLVP